MNSKKLSKPFVFAVAFHLAIVVLFGLSYMSEPDVVKQKPLPEIIQAAVVDDEIILGEAERLKNNKKNKQLARQKNSKYWKTNGNKNRRYYRMLKTKE